MSGIVELERRIRRLEDRAAIGDLVTLYGFIMDERDVGSIPRIFCEDATMRSEDGVFGARGVDEIIDTFKGRFAALGATNHFTHGHVVRFDDTDPDVATGVLASHAEVVRDGTTMAVALRYKDRYRRTPDGWKFADRLMSYMYYVDVREYADALRGEQRMRAYGDHRPADWPDALKGAPIDWLRELVD
jgi:ketosteroid isomerase-like protein